MREGITPEELAAISAQTITTYLAARLDFAGETACLWTGPDTIAPTGSGDELLDGRSFSPLAYGVVVGIGENSFTFNGSDELAISLNVPADVSPTISAAEVNPAEWRARPATLWRVMRLIQFDPLAAPIWRFRRIRSGRMDKVEVQNDGSSHTFNLTVESHQSFVSNATQQTYLDQKRHDPADTSQDYAVSIANGDPAPTKSPAASYGSGIDGQVRGIVDRARSLNQQVD